MSDPHPVCAYIFQRRPPDVGYQVRIIVDGRKVHLGTFGTLEGAQAARDAALVKTEIDPHGRRVWREGCGNSPAFPDSSPMGQTEPGRGARTRAEPEPAPPPLSDRAEDITEGNGRRVAYVSPDVRTLEEMVAACQIDLDIWHITRWEVNKWAVGAKVARRNLVFDEGKITGTLDDAGELTVAPLFQVKAWLVRKVPVAIHLPVQPVVIRSTERRQPPACQGDGLRRALILPDPQIGFRKNLRTGALEPFHDRSALDVAHQIASGAEAPFDLIVWLGDLLDCSEWSDKFLREPGFYFTTQPAVIEAAWWLRQFSACARGSKLIEGNHDNRVPLALMTHMLAAYEIRAADEVERPAALSLERLLCLEASGVEWVPGYPNSAVWLNEELRCIHGEVARSGIGDTAAKVAEISTVSTIFGHIHRIERATRTERRRGCARTITALSPGCLCRIDGTVPGSGTGNNWQQGIAVATYCSDGYHSTETIEIKDGRAAFGGKMYTACDPLPALVRDTGWRF